LQLHGTAVGVPTVGDGVTDAKMLGVGLVRLVRVVVGLFVTVALTVGVGVDEFELVQPATDKAVTTSTRTIIAVIGFNCICLFKGLKVT
jgi:hypothetical protein